MVPATAAHGSDEATAVLECTELTNKAFVGPSSARGERFIECILDKSPLSVRANLRHRLDTGKGGELLHRLNTGDDPPAISNSHCPYLLVASRSPYRTGDNYQIPFRNFLKKALAQVGFVIAQEDEFSYWSIHSLAREIDRESAVWSISMEAQPELGDGNMLLTRNFISRGSKRVEILWLAGLTDVFSINNAAALAKQFAEGAADALLPGAHWRCQNAALLKEEAELERIRDQLTREIIEAREGRAEQEKQLKIEVEQ
jgi:hypothetical protein